MTRRPAQASSSIGGVSQGRRNPHAPASDARNLIVTGMHRSGTSLLTESLSLLGWELPVDRSGTSVDNPRGHFEPAAVVAVNDRLLAATGSGWTRLAPFASDEIAALLDGDAVHDIGRALATSFGNASRRAIKDPRIALLAPLWQEWIRASGHAAHLIVALRNPFAVAQSLASRNRIPTGRALHAWTTHTLGALRLATAVPSLILPFPQWVASKADQDRLVTFCALPETDPSEFGGRIAGIFLPDALHAQGIRPRQDTGEIAGLAIELYQDAHAWALQHVAPDSAVIASYEARLLDLAQDLYDVETEGRQIARRLMQSRDASIDELRDRLRRTEHERQLLATDLAAQRAARQAEAEAHTAHAARTEGERNVMLGQMAADKAANVALGARCARAEEERDTFVREAAALRQACADDAARHAALTAERNAGMAERDRLVAERADLCRDIAALREQLDLRHADLAVAADAARTMAVDLSAAREAIAILSREKRALADSLMGAAERLHHAESARSGAERDLRALNDALAATFAEQRKTLEQVAFLSTAVAEAAARGERDRNALEARLRKEEMTVFRPIYRNIYRTTGGALRRVLRDTQVERLKRLLPDPDAIPRHLAERLPAASATGLASAAIMPRDMARDLPDIYVLSIINWDFRTQRPQHLSRDWAARGHRVFYVEMEQDLDGARCRRIAENLHVLRLGGASSDLIPTYGGVPDARQVARWVERLLAFADEHGAAPIAHVVIEHPYWWHFARALPPMFRLTFDCMDEMSGFANTDPAILAAERAMITGVDHMIVSSQYLHDKHAPHRPVTLVRNAADIDHFLPVAEGRVAPFRLPAPGPETRLRAGYVGAIAEWFDVDLIRQTALLAPFVEFHLCGAVTNTDALALRDLPNVTLHGEIPYAAVPGFLAAMDVMTIPFRLLPIIQACDPVKFYEYAAAAKPVVATAMPELARAGDLVLRAEGAPAFRDALLQASALADDPVQRAARVAYAQSNTWVERGTTFLTAIGRAPRVSVVILAYGDPALTLTTVHSLVGQGRVYPEMEIIVVDNGSPPVALATLCAYLDAVPCARLIENGRNLGFAGGNNVGIAAARGDYVLLLNNDTFVPPGAISAMVAHLERNPQIGVIGPMTNNIGNEARIEVNYADMKEMAHVAAEVTSGYRGQWSEIPVVAYFCALFRTADLPGFGPLDDAFGRGMFEDDDHCARIRAQGFVCALAEDAFVHHHLSASFSEVPDAERRALFDRNRAIYESRWGAWVPHRYRQTRPAPLAGAA